MAGVGCIWSVKPKELNLLNEWSDRQPDPSPQSRGSRVAAYVIGAVVVIGTLVFIASSLTSIASWFI